MCGGVPAGSRDDHGMQHGMSAMEWKVRTETKEKGACGVCRVAEEAAWESAMCSWLSKKLRRTTQLL